MKNVPTRFGTFTRDIPALYYADNKNKGALLIFCLTTYAGSRCIESPQLLVSAGIIAGTIGGALISHAMKCGKDD